MNADPIEFRLRYIKEPRDIAVIKAAAEKARMGDTRLRRAATKAATRYRVAVSPILSGTAPASPLLLEVDIDRSSGKIWARKFTVAHDCAADHQSGRTGEMHRRQHRAGREPNALGGSRL